MYFERYLRTFSNYKFNVHVLILTINLLVFKKLYNHLCLFEFQQ